MTSLSPPTKNRSNTSSWRCSMALSVDRVIATNPIDQKTQDERPRLNDEQCDESFVSETPTTSISLDHDAPYEPLFCGVPSGLLFITSDRSSLEFLASGWPLFGVCRTLQMLAWYYEPRSSPFSCVLGPGGTVAASSFIPHQSRTRITGRVRLGAVIRQHYLSRSHIFN